MEGILLFVILLVVSRMKLPEGVLFGTFIGCYGLFRSIGELFRQPDPQLGFLIGSLTMGELLSVPMAFLGFGMVLYFLGKKRPTHTISASST